MQTTLKEILQLFSLLVGLLLVGNVLFHLFIYVVDGTSISEVRWEIHTSTLVLAALFIFAGRQTFTVQRD